MATASFSIRVADARDIAVLAHHRAAMFRDMGALAPRNEPALEDASVAYLRGAIPGGEYLAWVAEDTASPRAIIGGVGAQLRSIFPRPRPDTDDLELGPEAILLNMYVQPAWRRRGVGRALMTAVLEVLAARGVRRIVLHSSDAGRHLYESMGFVPTNEMRLK
jgi:ribosomal protein S18 acetylase RimI-like enzyme